MLLYFNDIDALSNKWRKQKGMGICEHFEKLRI